MKHYKANLDEYINPDSKVQIISTFSGCGGLDLGATLNKYNVISSLENNLDCVETLKSNKVFSKTKHIFEDIRNIRTSDFNDSLKLYNPEKLIFLGGPPCQPFSKAGYWVEEKKRLGSDDPRNMIDHYINLIGEILPDGFILENVESILHPKNLPYVESIQNRIINIGYKLKTLKLNSADFGVPQKRKRVFFIASKEEINKDFLPTHGNEKSRLKNKNLKPWEGVKEWIEEYSSEEYSDGYDSAEGKYFEDLKKIKMGKNYMCLTEKYNYPTPKFKAGSRYWTFLLKLHPEYPSNTIISSPGHWEGPFHWENRRLRIKELAAIQTFPSDYNFRGSRRSIIKQIGNAVPPLLSKKIVKYLAENIK